MNSPCFGHSPWGPPAAARSELVRSGVSEGRHGGAWAAVGNTKRLATEAGSSHGSKKGLVDMGE